MPRFLSELPPKDDESLEHEPDLLAKFDGQRRTLGRSLLPFGGTHRSAIAAVTPDGSSSWMAAGELEPLNQTFCDPNSTPEDVAGRRGRKAWPEGVARRRGRKAWPEGVAERRGTKACSESQEVRVEYPGQG